MDDCEIFQGLGFVPIQNAINSNNTKDGDTITLADGIYYENVVVYKTLIIKPVIGANVTVQAENPYYGVFTVMNDGSSIQNLKIVGAAYSYGILGYATNLQITGNTIMANRNAITLFNSKSTTITNNIITANWYGTVLYNSTNTTITGNIITDNWYANSLYNSTGITISANNITSGWYGIFSNILNNSTVYGNNITGNSVGMQFYYSNCTISGNNVTGNDDGIVYYNSNCLISGNNVTGNLLVDTLVMDTAGVVMQNNIWNCGPASLATVLNRLGVNATQDDIASLAGTDYTGTSMAGLVYAAEVKGLNQSITAAGMLITNLDQLKPNNIVLLSTVSGLYHYCIITNITNTTVFLADSELGNINMTIGNFTSVYTGYVLVVTNDTNNTQFNNGTFLNYETMETIKGTNIFDNIYRNPFVNTGLNIGGYSLRVVFWPVAVVSFFAGLECVGGYNEAYYIDMWESTHSPSRNSNPPRYSPRYPKGHGSYPRSNPPTYSPPYVPPPVYPYTFWGIGLDGSYVLITGTTTGNPDDIKNQKILDAYNQKKAQELAKIAGIIDLYLNQKLNEYEDGKHGQKIWVLDVNGNPKEINLIRKSAPDGKDDGNHINKILAFATITGYLIDVGLNHMLENNSYDNQTSSDDQNSYDNQKNLSMYAKLTMSFTNKERIIQILTNGSVNVS